MIRSFVTIRDLLARLACPLAIAGLAGCAGERSAAMGGATRDTLPDGTVLVRYGSLAAPGAPTLEADLTLGTVDGDAALAFGSVRGIDAGRDGTIYVLDYQASEVRAFAPDGSYLHTVASRGEGPGEITEANGMILSGDTILWIQDHAKWTMLGVSPQGGELARYPMHVRSYSYIWNGTVDARGRFWKPESHSDREPVIPPDAGLIEGAYREYLKVFDPASVSVDSLYLGEVAYRTYVQVSGRSRRFRQIPFDPRPITVVDPAGGFWRTEAASYRIARLDEDGDTVLVVEAEVDPLPVTAQDRSALVAGVEESPRFRGGAEAAAALAPETKPMVASLVVDDRGRLWVRRTTADDPRGSTSSHATAAISGACGSHSSRRTISRCGSATDPSTPSF